MTFPVSLMWLLGGLLASGLAAFAMRRRGYGLLNDLGLGLGGSLVASLILQGLGGSAEAGLFAMALLAFLGGAGVLTLQRTLCPNRLRLQRA